MRPMGVMLDDYGFMSQRGNAQKVLDSLSGKKQPQMPPDGGSPGAVRPEIVSAAAVAGCGRERMFDGS